MLHWICPECGRDCSPAVRECPICVSAAQQSPAATELVTSDGVLALVQTLQAVPPVPLLAPVAANGQAKATAALTVEEPASQTDEAIDSLVRPLIESADAVVPTTECVEPKPAPELASLASDPPAAAKPSECVGAGPEVEPADVATEHSPALPSLARLAESVERDPPAELPVEPSTETSPSVEPLVAAAEAAFSADTLATPSVSEGTLPAVAPESEPAASPVKSRKHAARVKPVSVASAPPESLCAPVAEHPAATPNVNEECAESAPQLEKSLEIQPGAELANFETQAPPLAESPAEAAPNVEPLNAAASYPPCDPLLDLVASPASSAEPTPAQVESAQLIEPATEQEVTLKAACADASEPAEPTGAAATAEPEATVAATISEPAAEPEVLASVDASESAEPAGAAATAEPEATVAATISEPATEPEELATVADASESVEPASAAVTAEPATEPAVVAMASEPADAQPPATTEPKNHGTEEQANSLLSQALELEAEAIVDAVARQAEADNAAVRAVAASFEDRPKTSLLTAPSEIVEAPAPPASQWIRTLRPAIPARKPSDPSHNALASGPQTSALAGPCLPEQLLTFIEHKPAEQKPHRKSGAIPSWVISLVVATTLFLSAGRFLQYLANNKSPNAAAGQAQQSAQPAAAPAEPAVAAHPFAKFVEVTGLRVVSDPNRKSQVQYLVVNHSPSHISGVALKITVTPSEPSGAAPLFTVSSIVPSLGPYQSKEIRTDLDADLRSSSIPDWQYLRTEVQVGTQQ